MPVSHQAECPHCLSSFKLKSRAAVGKKVACPSCRKPFVIRLAPAIDEVDFVDDGDDFGDDDFGGGGFDELPARRPRPASRGAARGKSRKKKKRGESSGVGQVLVFGGLGLAALAVLVGAGWMITSVLGGMNWGGGIDFAYLPPDTEFVVQVKIRDLARSELLKDEMGQNEQGPFGGFGGGSSDITPEDITSMTLGVSGISELPQRDLEQLDNPLAAMGTLSKVEWVGVMRVRRPAKGGEPGFVEKQHGGTKYWAHQMMPIAYYLPSSRTGVFSNEEGIKKVIDRGKGSSSNSRFDFVDGSQHVVFAVAPKNPEVLRSRQPDVDLDSVSGMPESLKTLAENLRDGTDAMALGLSVDGDVDCRLQIATDSSTRAETVKTNLDDLVEFGRTNLGQYKGKLPPEVATLAEELLNDVRTSSSGNAVSLAVTVPGDVQDRMRGTNPNQMFGGMMPTLTGGGSPSAPSPPSFGGSGAPPSPPQVGNTGAGGNPFDSASLAEKLAKDRNNLKQIGLAIHNYHEAHRELPTGIRDADGKLLLSWRVQLLPFLERKDLYDRFDLKQSWDGPANRPLTAEMPEVFASPLHAGLAERGKTPYTAFSGAGAGLAADESLQFRDVTDGVSNTIAVLDVGSFSAVDWTRPDQTDIVHSIHVPNRLRASPAKGGHALFFDGSVRFFGEGVNGTGTPLAPNTLRAHLTRNGGETIEPGGNVAASTRTPAEDPATDDERANADAVADRVPGRKVVFQVAGFDGDGEPEAAARAVLARQPWADLSRFACDVEAGAVAVGLRGGFVNTGPAKAGLEAAGFQIGFTSVRMSPGRARAAGRDAPPGPQPAVDPDAPLETAAKATWLPIRSRTGRPSIALAVELEVSGGPAASVVRYGEVEVRTAKDEDGTPLRPFVLPEEYDYTKRFIAIEPKQRTPTGVKLYLVFRRPLPSRPIEKIAEIAGKLTLEVPKPGEAESKVELEFDFEDLAVPAQPGR